MIVVAVAVEGGIVAACTPPVVAVVPVKPSAVACTPPAVAVAAAGPSSERGMATCVS